MHLIMILAASGIAYLTRCTWTVEEGRSTKAEGRRQLDGDSDPTQLKTAIVARVLNPIGQGRKALRSKLLSSLLPSAFCPLPCPKGDKQNNWSVRWRRSLFLFLFPPLLIFTTAIALLCMGPQGEMGGLQTGCFGYVMALGCIAFFTIVCFKLTWEGWQSVKSARKCPLVNLAGRQVRVLSTGALFAGQIGFWQPELVLSQGLLQTLSKAHLETVLAHEHGHYHYRDTFWFFWLGWVRSCTAWLPNTDALWQELLVLRELRADAHAASQVDPLLLAESLLLVVSTPPISSEICCAALGSPSVDRLNQRIDALLAQPEPTPEDQLQSWNYFLFAFLPLMTVIFHS